MSQIDPYVQGKGENWKYFVTLNEIKFRYYNRMLNTMWFKSTSGIHAEGFKYFVEKYCKLAYTC